MPYARPRSKNREKIVQALIQVGGVTFTGLLQLTGLSRSTLSNYLKKLMHEGYVKRIRIEKTGEVHYSLTAKAMEDKPLAATLFNIDSHYIFKESMDGAVDQSITDADFLKRFYEKIGVLITYALLQALNMENYEDAKKWVAKAINPQSWITMWISILAWRLFYKRTLPSTAVEILREDLGLSGIKRRFEEMKGVLRQLQPEDVEFLDSTFEGLEDYVRSRKISIKCRACGFEDWYDLRELEIRCKKCGELFYRRILEERTLVEQT